MFGPTPYRNAIRKSSLNRTKTQKIYDVWLKYGVRTFCHPKMSSISLNEIIPCLVQVPIVGYATIFI